MSFVVSARKYRPQNFDELIGQDHIAQTLKNALKNDKLAHAFLFSGPRGVGKTTSARILAKVLNCQDLQDNYKSCGKCDSCKAFVDNASFNIFELDAASNNSVEHIRALNEQVRFQPQQGSYKIYIIDEVHMLSQAAFNAFLKTLEEPPPYAKFILATTEKHKIIPTILSRCQIFDFRRIQIKDIVSQLNTIAKKEKRKIDDEALHLVAQKADGAMRDALSIYDKVVSSVEGNIGYKEVAENLKLSKRYEDQAGLANNSFLLTGLSILNQTDINLQRSQNKRLSVEIALSKMAYMNRVVSTKENVPVTSKPLMSASVTPVMHKASVPVKPEMKAVKAEPPSQKNDLAPKAKTDSKSKKALPVNKAAEAAPRVTSDIDSLLKSIEKEEKAKIKKSQDLKPGNVRKILDEYKAQVSSNSVKTAIDHVKIDIEGENIKILAATQIYLDFIKQELKLLEDIHLAFPGKDLKILFVVSEETFPNYEPPKKPKHLTTKEKYELLLSKNPKFEKLIREFNLKLNNQ